MLARRYTGHSNEKRQADKHAGIKDSRSTPSRLKMTDKLGNRGLNSFLQTLRANATVSNAHDSREREADRIADSYGASNTNASRHQTDKSVTLSRNNKTQQTPTSTANSNQLFSSGQPLTAITRERMESHLGQDLSAVRIHDNSEAHVAARGLGAHAFTMGSNIAFARGRYQPDSSLGQKLLAHELAHVTQQQTKSSSGAHSIQLKRDPDVVFKGYYSFYLTQGRANEFAVQFYYPGTGNMVIIKVAHQPSGTMRQGTITLPEGASFNPIATIDGATTTLFDLDGDGSEEVAIQAVVDDYRAQYATADSSPTSPTYKWYDLHDVYVVASLGGGGSFSFQVKDVPPPEAVTAPNWVMRSHPHPSIGMAMYDTQSSRYVIPPVGGFSSRYQDYDGPPPYFSQATKLSSLNTSYSPAAAGGEALNDPFAMQGPTQSDLTIGHESLAAMPALAHDNVPTWDTEDVAWWKSIGGQQYLYDYKDRWVRGYRAAIRAAADTYNIPRVLLAGVAWVEVGGDPDWIDSAAYAVRGREGELTTSVAPMSLQIRRAGEELGYDPATMNDTQRDAVQSSLEDPQQAIFIAARHLASLRDVDFAGKGAADLSTEEVAVIAKRFNIGPDIPLAQVRLNLDYGIAILNRGQHLLDLLKD